MDHLKFLMCAGLTIVLVIASALVYTQYTNCATIEENREMLYQISTIDALMLGAFDGIQPVGELRPHGDFGIGTFDALDGEMIVLDGIVYQAKADGHIYQVPDNFTTPLATVTHFDRDFVITTERLMNYTDFSSVMTERLPTQNMIYAVRIHATFPLMKVRAIPAQERPYPTLTDAAKNQSVYTYTNTTGSVVGFYIPVFFRGLNVAGYHIHFISDDQERGGHILDFTVPSKISVDYDITPEFEMELPTSGAFTGIDLSQDLSTELAKVEK